jgi:hypothetical protein
MNSLSVIPISKGRLTTELAGFMTSRTKEKMSVLEGFAVDLEKKQNIYATSSLRQTKKNGRRTVKFGFADDNSDKGSHIQLKKS